ncbi:MAG: hypothetical protein LWW93_01220 [Hyphomicrobiales bacterium]|nr:hypothetical protein [Hyphomicrobiales bacterium]
MAIGVTEEAIADRLSPEALAAANINPNTRLATDYLNHFNNVVMMLELVPDMPDCAEDVVGWTPVAYDDYFRGSHFRERDLAILAWEKADPTIRSEFESTVTHLDCAMAEAIDLVSGFDGSDPIAAERIRFMVGERLKPLIASASGIINGPPAVHAAPVDPSESEAQAAVDELFP